MCNCDEFKPPYPPAYIPVVADSYTVQASGTDTTSGFLSDKIKNPSPATSGITLTLQNAGANEYWQISHNGTLRVTAGDTTPDFLSSKITNSSAFVITVTGSGNQHLNFALASQGAAPANPAPPAPFSAMPTNSFETAALAYINSLQAQLTIQQGINATLITRLQAAGILT
jgi:hypothetical protein